MHKLILILFPCFFISCSREFYNSVAKEISEYNEKGVGRKINYKSDKIDIAKILTSKKVNADKDSFIAIFHWVDHLPRYNTKDFRLLFYNYKTKERTYIYNYEKDINTIIIEKDKKANLFHGDSIILSKILSNGLESINKIKQKCIFYDDLVYYYVIVFAKNKYYFYVIDEFCPDGL